MSDRPCDKARNEPDPWECGNCGAEVQAGVQCPLCGASLCPACDGSGGVLYFNGETEHMGPCHECDALGVIPLEDEEMAA
jgi:hypothetical protein